MKAEQGSLVPAERKSEGPEVSQGSDTTFRCVSAPPPLRPLGVTTGILSALLWESWVSTSCVCGRPDRQAAAWEEEG